MRILLPVLVLTAACSGADSALDGALLDGVPSQDGGADFVSDRGVDGADAPISVATLNLYCLKDDPTARVAGIADEIVQRGVVAIGLQEVCQRAGKPEDNLAAALVVALEQRTSKRWSFRWTRTHLAWDQYDEGLAVVARQDALDVFGELALPRGDGPFPRKVLWTEVRAGQHSLLLYVTHLTISKTPRDRAAQSAALVTLLASHESNGLPRVVVGDFNDVAQSDTIKTLVVGPPDLDDTYRVARPADPGQTCCAPGFSHRIDYVFSEAGAFSVEGAEVAFTAGLSDHRGVVATLRRKP